MIRETTPAGRRELGRLISELSSSEQINSLVAMPRGIEYSIEVFFYNKAGNLRGSTLGSVVGLSEDSKKVLFETTVTTRLGRRNVIMKLPPFTQAVNCGSIYA